ncbi:DNA-binding transcriptional regulator, MarR family [Micromonospora nigra]|uniref:DNA-binding transcriptional regulator, MarR family n=1 Tax=Micromonospora nigra TaxID=145857 RepID=A0A1C6RMG2_9ACTN|nr:MarR family transcriptional regulator [Micromonospora nigra]SCL18362.1 DNA-binding transcriptional regulator, MarR family [Micromonospora nigra]
MAVELDSAAGALLAVWESARERTTSRVSAAQLRVVMLVERHDGINLRRLASGLDMLLSSASRLCDRLVAAGMLEREPGRTDRREISLHLTPEAHRLLAELRGDRRRQLAAILSGMTVEGREALLRGLREFNQAALARDARPLPSLVPAGEDWPAAPDPEVSAPEPRPSGSAFTGRTADGSMVRTA